MCFVLTCANSESTENIDSEGMHNNVNVPHIDDLNVKVNKINPTADIKNLYNAAPHKSHYTKPHSICIQCEYVFTLPQSIFADSLSSTTRKQDSILIRDTTTLRRHMAFLHPVRPFILILESLFIVVTQKMYRKWCQENNFESMLPKLAVL